MQFLSLDTIMNVLEALVLMKSRNFHPSNKIVGKFVNIAGDMEVMYLNCFPGTSQVIESVEIVND